MLRGDQVRAGDNQNGLEHFALRTVAVPPSNIHSLILERVAVSGKYDWAGPPVSRGLAVIDGEVVPRA